MSSKFTQIVTSFVSALFVLCSIFWCTQISQAQDNITALVGAPANHYCYSTVHTPINILWTPGIIIKPDSTTPMTWQLCFNSGRLVDEDTTTLQRTRLYIPNGTNQFATGSIFYTRVMNYGGFDHYGNLGCNPVWYKGTSIDCKKCSQNTYPCGLCQELNASSFVGLEGLSNITIPDKSVITVKKANGTPIQGAKVYVLNDDGNYYNREIRTTDSTGKVSYNIYERTPVSFYAVPYKGFNFRGNNHTSYYSPVPETIQVPNVDSTVTVTRLGSPVRNARVEITNAQNSRINNTTIYTDSNGQASFAVPDGTAFKFYVEINGAPYISSTTRVAPFNEQFYSCRFRHANT